MKKISDLLSSFERTQRPNPKIIGTPRSRGSSSPESQKADRGCKRCIGGFRLRERDGFEGVVECPCRKRRRYRGIVPQHFAKFNLGRLKPQPARHPLQADAIAALQADPHASYLLCGRNGAGKSLMGWCLLRQAVCESRRVVGINLAVLLDQYRALEKPLREEEALPPRPRITALDLEGPRNWFLLLQEFDKPRPTEYASERLFELVDMAFNYEHQLVITSNMDADELDAHWSTSSPRFGRSIMSRLRETCVQVNLF